MTQGHIYIYRERDRENVCVGLFYMTFLTCMFKNTCKTGPAQHRHETNNLEFVTGTESIGKSRKSLVKSRILIGN